MKNTHSVWRKTTVAAASVAALAFSLVATVLPIHSALASPAQGNSTETVQQEAPSVKYPRHFMVYYRAWRDKTMKGVNTSLPDPNWLTMHDIPYGVDVVNVFSYVPAGQESQAKPYFDKLKSDYTPYLHSRGIKLVRGIDYAGVILNGFMNYVSDDVDEDDYRAAALEPQSKFDQYAQKVIDEQMKPWGLDGLDIDMENYPSSDQIAVSNKVIEALSRKIGPKSDNPSKTIFLYDTNGSWTQVFKDVKDCFNFLAYQQYGSSSDRTARAVSDYQTSADLSPTKFVPGLTFPEEQDRNNRWIDTANKYEDSNIYHVARYVRDHNLGGMFLYAFDRDGRTYNNDDLNSIKPSNLLWTKTAIAESQGMTLPQAKAAASHFLDRMSLVRTVPASVRSAVKDAPNLYEVNKAILGSDYGKGFSNTYDPMLESALMTVNTKPSFDALQTAKKMLTDSSIKATLAQSHELDAAQKNLINGLTGKAYTADSMAQLLSPMTKIIQEIQAEQKPSEPSEPSNPSHPTKPTEPENPTQPEKPSNPSQPTNPTKPSKPSQPTHPANPTKPAQSEKPVKPTKPVQSVKPSQQPQMKVQKTNPKGFVQSPSQATVTSNRNTMPKTGTSVAIVAVVAAVLVAAGGAVGIYRAHQS